MRRRCLLRHVRQFVSKQCATERQVRTKTSGRKIDIRAACDRMGVLSFYV